MSKLNSTDPQNKIVELKFISQSVTTQEELVALKTYCQDLMGEILSIIDTVGLERFAEITPVLTRTLKVIRSSIPADQLKEAIPTLSNSGLIETFPVIINLDVKSMALSTGNSGFLKYLAKTIPVISSKVSTMIQTNFNSINKPLSGLATNGLVRNKETDFYSIITKVTDSYIEIVDTCRLKEGYAKLDGTETIVESYVFFEEYEYLGTSMVIT